MNFLSSPSPSGNDPKELRTRELIEDFMFNKNHSVRLLPSSILLNMAPEDILVVIRAQRRITVCKDLVQADKGFQDRCKGQTEEMVREMLRDETWRKWTQQSEKTFLDMIGNPGNKKEMKAVEAWVSDLEEHASARGSSTGGSGDGREKEPEKEVKAEESETSSGKKKEEVKGEAAEVEEDDLGESASQGGFGGEEEEEEEEESEKVVKGSKTVIEMKVPEDLTLFLIDLANGLQYDKFDARVIRKVIKDKGSDPMDVLRVLMAYVFVGNNPANLSSKVKVQAVGKSVLAVVNKLGIVRTKVDSSTLTLARVAIAFAPSVWCIRRFLSKKKLLPSSGVNTTTPLELQDVSLSALSVSLKFENEIKDFLLKFNRVLTKAHEKSAKEKTKEEEMDATCEKFIGLSTSNAQLDDFVFKWKPRPNNYEKQALEFIINSMNTA